MLRPKRRNRYTLQYRRYVHSSSSCLLGSCKNVIQVYNVVTVHCISKCYDAVVFFVFAAHNVGRGCVFSPFIRPAAPH